MIRKAQFFPSGFGAFPLSLLQPRRFQMGLPLSRIGLRYQVGLVGLIGFFGLIVLGLLYYIGLDQQTRAPRVADAATAARGAIRRSEANFLGNPSSSGLARRGDQVAPLGKQLAKIQAEISPNGGAGLVQTIDYRAAGTADVSRTITGVAGAAGQAAEHVLDSSSELAKQAERLRMEVERFLANVRAA
jgi:hypothetical protein